MSIVLHRQRILYLPTPKVACSAVKAALFELETSDDRLSELRQRGVSIHRVYPTVENGGPVPEYTDDYLKSAIVRDPVERFVSGHASIIGRSGGPGLSRAVKMMRLSDRPSLDEFVSRFPLYYSLDRRVRHHFAPQANFIGRGFSDLSHVYWLDEMDRLADDIGTFTGQSFRVPSVNRTGRSDPVDSALHQSIAEYMAKDYQMLGSLRALDKPHRTLIRSRLRGRLDEPYVALPARLARKALA